jgi:hypothetical protein
LSRISTLTNNDRPWLHTVHEKKKDRSFQLGKTTIDVLVQEGIPVTLKNIHEKSSELDSTGKGIHPNTVSSNDQLYEYYKQFSKTYKQKQTKKSPPTINLTNETVLIRLNSERDLTHVRQKYMKLSKHELVERLIQAEQFIANNHNNWSAQLFDKFTK